MATARGLLQPKRSSSAYFLFCQDHRRILKEELANQDAESKACANKMAALARLSGRNWKALTQEQQRPYCERAAALREQHLAEMKEFKSAGGVYVPSRRRARDCIARPTKKRKEEREKEEREKGSRPRKPSGGAFGVYLSDHRMELKRELPVSATLGALNRLAGQRWKALSAQERSLYEERYRSMRSQYGDLMQQFSAAEERYKAFQATARPLLGELSPWSSWAQNKRAREKMSANKRSLQEEFAVVQLDDLAYPSVTQPLAPIAP